MKKIGLVSTGLLLSLALLGGCAQNSGNQVFGGTEENKLPEILVKGVTTKAEVKAKFGDPCDVDLDNNNCEKWTYTHIRATAKVENFLPVVSLFRSGQDYTNRKLVILFNKDDVLEKYIVSSAKGSMSQGSAVTN